MLWAAAVAASAPSVLIGAVAAWRLIARNVPASWATVVLLAVIASTWIGPAVQVLGLVRRRRRLLEIGGLVAMLTAFFLSIAALFIAGGTQSMVVLVIAAGMFIAMFLATLAISGLAETWRDLEGRAVPPDRARRWDAPGGGRATQR